MASRSLFISLLLLGAAIASATAMSLNPNGSDENNDPPPPPSSPEGSGPAGEEELSPASDDDVHTIKADKLEVSAGGDDKQSGDEKPKLTLQTIEEKKGQKKDGVVKHFEALGEKLKEDHEKIKDALKKGGEEIKEELKEGKDKFTKELKKGGEKIKEELAKGRENLKEGLAHVVDTIKKGLKKEGGGDEKPEGEAN